MDMHIREHANMDVYVHANTYSINYNTGPHQCRMHVHTYHENVAIVSALHMYLCCLPTPGLSDKHNDLVAPNKVHELFVVLPHWKALPLGQYLPEFS